MKNQQQTEDVEQLSRVSLIKEESAPWAKTVMFDSVHAAGDVAIVRSRSFPAGVVVSKGEQRWYIPWANIAGAWAK